MNIGNDTRNPILSCQGFFFSADVQMNKLCKKIFLLYLLRSNQAERKIAMRFIL